GAIAVAQLVRKADSALHRQLDITFHALMAEPMAGGMSGAHAHREDMDPAELLAIARSDTVAVLRGAATAFQFGGRERRLSVVGMPYDSVTREALTARL